MKLASVNKAIVALVGVVVAFGILDEGTAQSLVGVLTAVAVWAVPNSE